MRTIIFENEKEAKNALRPGYKDEVYHDAMTGRWHVFKGEKMPSIIRDDCPCCRKGSQELRGLKLEELRNRKQIYLHCEPCWNRYHNGKKHKDFDPKLAPPYEHAQSR